MSEPPPKAPWRLAAAETLRGGPLAVAVPAAAGVAALAFALLSPDAYWLRELSLIAVLALVIGGLNLTFGYAGELQLGQVFAFGIGCYAAMAFAVHVWDELLVALLIGGGVAAAAGALLAWAAARIGGWPLAITSLVLVTLLPSLVSLVPAATGGLNGLIDIPPPRLLGRPLDDGGLCGVAVLAAVAWTAVLRNLVTSRPGVVLRSLRRSPVLVASLGLSPTRVRVLAYALGAFPAGVAGCLFGFVSLVVTPSAFGVALATGVVAASILGGVESVYGAIVAAAVLQLGPEGSLSLAQYAPVGYGAFLIVVAIAFRGGLSGLARGVAEALAQRLAGPRPRAQAPGQAAPSVLGPASGGGTLTVSSATRRFGAALALDAVSLTARPGEVTGLIGSNGSGKTTLLNLICGVGGADGTGTVTLDGRSLTGLTAQAVARAGVARTFQAPHVPRGVTALEVVASGRFARDPQGLWACILRRGSFRRSRRADRREALALLEVVGLGDVAADEAATLPLGAQRLLEVARALCARPRVLLLDEPAAGLGAPERDRLGRTLRQVARAGATVVVVEHDVAWVTEVADVAHALHAGRLVASGPARSLAADPAVVESLMGRAPEPRVGPPARPRARTGARVEVRGLAAGYDGGLVLRDVDLLLEPGTLEVVVGPSGAGKTTLLATLAGQVGLRAGTIALDGSDVGSLPAHRRAGAGIAFVPEGRRIFRQQTVAANVALGTFPLRLTRRERAALCDRVLDDVPALASRSGELAGDLSGGQQQLLAIAQALAARPRLLLLDEPSAGLAPSVVTELLADVRRLSAHGLTIVLADQLAGRAPAVADHVTVLRAGGRASTGPPEPQPASRAPATATG